MGRHEHNNKNEKKRKRRRLKVDILEVVVEDDANTSKIYYLKMIQEQSIGNNLHFGDLRKMILLSIWRVPALEEGYLVPLAS
jgi:hypothetical protein